MITVLLYGALGRRFGRRHRYAIRTPAEALRALAANFPDFRCHLRDHSEPGYRVFVGKAGRDLDALTFPADDVIRIVPVVAGASGGGGRVLAGLALIGISIATGGWGMGLGAAWTAGIGTFAGAMAGNIGVSMVLGGVAEMLSPAPRAQSSGGVERPDNKPSYSFDGAVNTVAQGNPVPVCYGRLIVGSQVVSAGLMAEDIPA